MLWKKQHTNWSRGFSSWSWMATIHEFLITLILFRTRPSNCGAVLLFSILVVLAPQYIRGKPGTWSTTAPRRRGRAGHPSKSDTIVVMDMSHHGGSVSFLHGLTECDLKIINLEHKKWSWVQFHARCCILYFQKPVCCFQTISLGLFVNLGHFTVTNWLDIVINCSCAVYRLDLLYFLLPACKLTDDDYPWWSRQFTCFL